MCMLRLNNKQLAVLTINILFRHTHFPERISLHVATMKYAYVSEGTLSRYLA